MSVESQVVQADIHWVCAQPAGMFRCCLQGMVTILTGGGWQDGHSDSIPWSHHTAHGMGISWEEVSGPAAAALLCSLPSELVPHSSEAEVPVCWGGSPLPVSSEGLAPFSALLLPESV